MSDDVLRIESDGTPEGDEAVEDLRQFLIDGLQASDLSAEEKAEMLRQLQRGKPAGESEARE